MSGMPATLFLVTAIILTALYLRRLRMAGTPLVRQTLPERLEYPWPIITPPRPSGPGSVVGWPGRG